MRLALLLCLAASPAPAQDLVRQPDLAPGVAATPRLPEATGAAARINARLADLDAEALASWRDLAVCDPSPGNTFLRGVDVTLNAPGLVSLLVQEEGYCAPAAHPWTTAAPLVFDRRSGAEVDPLSWLPPFLSPGPEPEPWTEQRALARFGPLTSLYIHTALRSRDPGIDLACLSLLRRQPHGFDLWPDASAPGLVLQPAGLAHVDTPCETPVTIPLATLTSLGVSPALLSALAAGD